MPEVKPQHILFLCVENSARSQMAEGLARSMAPENVIISSAGSRPTRLRPEAVQAMQEAGIDISSQRAKGIDEIDSGSVDLVVTLCSDQICPILPSSPRQLHWPLPDPAAVKDAGGSTMEAFRATRDELKQRIESLFESPPESCTDSTVSFHFRDTGPDR